MAQVCRIFDNYRMWIVWIMNVKDIKESNYRNIFKKQDEWNIVEIKFDK